MDRFDIYKCDADRVPIQGFSNSSANPGEVRACDLGLGKEATELLIRTSGYQLNSDTDNFSISTSVGGCYNGFTSLFHISGTSLIRGGGMFQLTFAPYINVEGFNFMGGDPGGESVNSGKQLLRSRRRSRAV